MKYLRWGTYPILRSVNLNSRTYSPDSRKHPLQQSEYIGSSDIKTSELGVVSDSYMSLQNHCTCGFKGNLLHQMHHTKAHIKVSYKMVPVDV